MPRWPATFWIRECARPSTTSQGLVHPGGMLVSINPERLLVQIDRNLGQSTEALALAVSEALVIHDGLQAGVSRRMGEGIEIVVRDRTRRAKRWPAHLQGLRRTDQRRRRRLLLELQHTSSSRLLGIRRILLDLRLRMPDVPTSRQVPRLTRLAGPSARRPRSGFHGGPAVPRDRLRTAIPGRAAAWVPARERPPVPANDFARRLDLIN